MLWRIFDWSVCKLALFWPNCFPQESWAYMPAWRLRRVRLLVLSDPDDYRARRNICHGMVGCVACQYHHKVVSAGTSVCLCVAGYCVTLLLGRNEQISTHPKVSWWQTKVRRPPKSNLNLLGLTKRVWVGVTLQKQGQIIHSNWITKTPPPSCDNSQKLETRRALQGLQLHKRKGPF